jgi:hypothetical protein
MNTKSQVDFDLLLQLHMLDNTEEDNDMSWECQKVFDYCKQKGDVNSSDHNCLVEWNDINKTKSWVNYGLFLIKSQYSYTYHFICKEQ